MISKTKNIESNSPIVNFIVLSVLKNLRYNNTSLEIHKQRNVIDTSFVPKFSRRIIQASNENPLIEKQPHLRKLIEPLPRTFPPSKTMQQDSKKFPKKIIPQPQFTSSNFMEIKGNYGAIDTLIKDPSVSSIECQGEGKTILITRAGQKMQTKISLREEQIKSILETIAENAKVPLLEGVFKAAVDNFTINAVVSDLIGSRFVIKKQTPYALLER